MKPHALLLMLACAACSRPAEVPKDILPRDTFKHALLGSQLIEARLNHEMVIDQRKDMPVKQYYSDMFKEEGITEEAFRKTFQWYAEHPEELKGVYTEILTELQQRADSTAH